VKTFAYVRVSTTRQASEGESLDAQQRQIAGYCQMHEMKLDETFVEEGVSGSIPIGQRPEGKKLFAALQKGDNVIASKLDRMFRSALDALNVVEALKAKGVRLHLLDLGGDVSGNGISKLFLTIASAFAEAERDRIRERVSMAKADQKKRGRFLGGARPPFGFRANDNGDLVKDEREQAAIREIIKLRRKGQPLRKIAEALAANGHKLSFVTVGEIVKRHATGR
jgi:putative DNA-invertase from lambdoid prophage Rac